MKKNLENFHEILSVSKHSHSEVGFILVISLGPEGVGSFAGDSLDQGQDQWNEICFSKPLEYLILTSAVQNLYNSTILQYNVQTSDTACREPDGIFCPLNQLNCSAKLKKIQSCRQVSRQVTLFAAEPRDDLSHEQSPSAIYDNWF